MSLMGNTVIHPLPPTIGSIETIEALKENCKGKDFGIALLLPSETLNYEFFNFGGQETISQQSIKMLSYVGRRLDDKGDLTILISNVSGKGDQLGGNLFSTQIFPKAGVRKLNPRFWGTRG